MGESKKEKPEVDRITSLPDDLLHSVMFRLCTRDAARMSLLSKRWDMVWRRFPIIDIDEANYRSREDLAQGMRLYLLRHYMDHLQKLRLHLPMNEEIYHLTDGFINAAIRGQLQKLDLNFYMNGDSRKEYIVPKVVFSEGSSLRSLRVTGCDFKSYEVLNLQLLRKLSLRHVQLEEDLVERLIQSCPLLESFSLDYYRGPKSIKIVHERIRKVELSINGKLEELEIHLPDLQSLKYRGYYSEEGYITAAKFETLSKIAVYKLQSFYLKRTKLEAETFQSMQLKNIKRLLFHYIQVEDETLQFIDLRFPFLEFLSLKACMGLKEVKVLSLRIEAISVVDCVDLEYCKIVAPNLLFFKYQGSVMTMARINASGRLQVDLNFRLPIHHVDLNFRLLQRLRLRNFLRAFNGANKMTIQLNDNCDECMKVLNGAQHLL